MNHSRFLDFNGRFYHTEEAIFRVTNRSYRYGDGLFETMRWENREIQLLNYHVDRLQKSMDALKMEGGKLFNSSFIHQKVTSLLEKNQLIESECRIRFSVFRDGEGLYTPQTNQSAYVIEVNKLDKKVNVNNQSGLIVDIFQDHRKPQNSLSNIKSSNAILYVLAGIYRKKHGLDDVLLINESGFLVESSSSNFFVWYNGMLYTPALSEGCVDGVMRRSILEFARENEIEIIEAQINPHILNEADEIFLTNAIHGMQCVLGYKKKRYFNHLSKDLWQRYEQWQRKIAEESNSL
ncbi:aminotransferase class IV [Albibacterium sp.]|uniref:aminotransferase class IV n=1 Tax=Albibacterium sp. TaxID=2952885 RepID=UPI002C29435B|nr:aminotransferase class IV [Albibacterium sp.]HUH18497.1 aminotransferase class IV [Albibacterium sp.]